MPKAKQQKEQAPKAEVVVEKKIRKTKKTKAEEQPPQPASPPQSPVKKGRKQEKKVKAVKERFNKLYYPETPNLQFPNQLQESVINVIASFGKSAPLKDITNNLSLFYQNDVQETVVNQFLASAEEQGTLYERAGQYHVSDELVPAPPKEPEPQPEVKQPIQDHDQIDFEEQIQNHASEKKDNLIENEEQPNPFD